MDQPHATDIRVITEQITAAGEGMLALTYHNGQWCVAIEWGREAEDSPMVAAAAYGVGATAQEAIKAAQCEAGWS